MANGIVTFGEIAAFLPMLEVRCDNCGGQGRYRNATLIEKYGGVRRCSPFRTTSGTTARNGTIRADLMANARR